MSLAKELRRLADLEAIRDLARRYAHCVWMRDVPGAIALFTDDGVMDPGTRPPIRGRAALLDSYQAILGPSVFQPFLHNHVIELGGDEATGVCHLVLRATVEGRSLIGCGHYEDVYARERTQWRFRSRRLVMEYPVPVNEGWADVISAGTPTPS